MRIRMLCDGDAPDLGPFEAGDERLVPEAIGSIYIRRGMAEEIRPRRPRREVKRDAD